MHTIKEKLENITTAQPYPTPPSYTTGMYNNGPQKSEKEILDEDLKNSGMSENEKEKLIRNLKIMKETAKELSLFKQREEMTTIDVKNIFENFYSQNLDTFVTQIDLLPYRLLMTMKEKDIEIFALQVVQESLKGLEIHDNEKLKTQFMASFTHIQNYMISQMNPQGQQVNQDPFWQKASILTQILEDFHSEISKRLGLTAVKPNEDDEQDNIEDEKVHGYGENLDLLIKQKNLELKDEILRKYIEIGADKMISVSRMNGGERSFNKIAKNLIQEFENFLVNKVVTQTEIYEREGGFSKNYESETMQKISSKKKIHLVFKQYLEENGKGFMYGSMRQTFEREIQGIMEEIYNKREELGFNIRQGMGNGGQRSRDDYQVSRDMKIIIRGIINDDNCINFFPRVQYAPNMSLNLLYPLIIDTLILAHPLKYEGYSKHIEWVRQLIDLFKIEGSFGSHSHQNLLDLVESISRRRIYSEQIKDKTIDLKRRIGEYQYEN